MGRVRLDRPYRVPRVFGDLLRHPIMARAYRISCMRARALGHLGHLFHTVDIFICKNFRDRSMCPVRPMSPTGSRNLVNIYNLSSTVIPEKYLPSS